jgi:TRAP-type C4-dicarboxylate transport system permease small subunit
MKKIFAVLDWVINNFIYFGGAVMILLMFFTTINTVGRLFNSPIAGDIEITVNALVCIVYSTIASCVINDKHIKIDIFTKCPWLNHFNNAFAFATSLFISIESFNQGLKVVRMQYVSQLLQIPRAPFVFISALGFFLFAVAILSVEYRSLVSYKEEKRKAKLLSGGPGSADTGAEGGVK